MENSTLSKNYNIKYNININNYINNYINNKNLLDKLNKNVPIINTLKYKYF